MRRMQAVTELDAPVANPAVASVSMFFPCYNDAETITLLVRVALRTLEQLGIDGDVIVINDGSSDNSASVLHALQATQPRLRVVTHEQNRGYGGALLSGFAAADKQWVFYTDGDAQYDPRELALLVAAASDEVDVVQGYKLQRADGQVRGVIGSAYNSFVRRLFGLQIQDTDCDFRLIRQSLLEEIRLEHTSGAICVELVRKLQDAGARFTEVGVHHYRRPHGRSQFFRVGRIGRTFTALGRLRKDLWLGRA